jgi:hypothetical protein
LSSLALEWLAGGDAERGARNVKAEHPRTLFRAGLSLVALLQETMLARLETARLPRVDELRRQWQLDRRGAALVVIESFAPVLGFERAEALKGLFNRFPVRPVATTERPEGGGRRTLFKPIATLADLRAFATELDGLAGLLRLAELADGSSNQLVDLDRRLLTALGQTLAGGAFRYEPLDASALERVRQLPAEAARTLTADLFSGIEGSLRVELFEGAGWSVSRAAAGILPGSVDASDPVQPAMAELSDLVLRLGAARETGLPLDGLLDVTSPRTMETM